MQGQRKAGFVLSYVSIFLSSIVGVLFTPYMISSLGEVEYGLYQMLHASIGYIALLDFGLGSTLTRFILKYKSKGDFENVKTSITMCVKIYCLFGTIAMLAVWLVSFHLDDLFVSSVTADNLGYARQLFIIMGATTSLSLVSHALTGVQTSHEKYIITKGIYIFRQLARVFLIIVLIQIKAGALAVVLADFIVTLSLVIFDIYYCKVVLKSPIFIGKWDWKLFKSLFSFSSFVFMQIMITQTNNGLDRVLLGRFSTFEVVALYGVVMQLHSLFNSVGGVISSITLPKISKAVFSDADRNELTDCCVKFSRFQFYISLLLIGGFVLLGRDFVGLWVPGYNATDVWILVLLIVAPQMIESVEGTVFNAMKAKNKQAPRSLILLGVMIANVIMTVALIKVSPIYGPAIGTCISFVVGNNIICNIFYHKKIGVNMIRFFRKLCKGILPAGLIAFAIGVLITFIPLGGWIGFVVKGCLYVLVYGVCQFALGLNKSERSMLNSILRKVIKR